MTTPNQTSPSYVHGDHAPRRNSTRLTIFALGIPNLMSSRFVALVIVSLFLHTTKNNGEGKDGVG